MMSKTLILYEEDSLDILQKLLLNYSEDTTLIQVDDYKANNISSYDYIFVTNINDKIENHSLINDLVNSNQKIFWIGNGIENILNKSDKYSIKYIGKSNDIIEIKTKDFNGFIGDSEDFNIVQAKEDKNNNVKVLAKMTDGYNEYPYMIKDKNLYYLSNSNIKNNYIFSTSVDSFYNFKKIERIKNENTNNEHSSITVEENNTAVTLKKINDFVVSFILFVIIIFTLVFIRFKVINRNKFKRR